MACALAVNMTTATPESTADGGLEAEDEEAVEAPRSRFHVNRLKGPIAAGDYGMVVTLGSFARIKVDAQYGAILPGDLLVSSPTPGHAMVAERPEIGTVIGKALGSLQNGSGEIPVFVSPR